LLRKRADLVFSALILVLAVWMVWEARDWVMRTRLFPWTIGIPAVALAGLQLIFAVRNATRPESEPVASAAPAHSQALAASKVESSDTEADRAVVAAAVESAFGEGSEAAAEDAIPPEVVRRRTLVMSAWILAFGLTVFLLGFKVSAALSTAAFLRFGARDSWKTTFWISLTTYLFFYLIFDYALNIPFPPGWIAESLGLQSLDSYLVEPLMRLVLRR